MLKRICKKPKIVKPNNISEEKIYCKNIKNVIYLQHEDEKTIQ